MSGSVRRTSEEGHRVGCRDLRNAASDYVEGVLPAQEAEHVRRHMDLCPGCGRFMASFRQMIDTLHGMPQTPAPERLKDRLRHQFHQRP